MKAKKKPLESIALASLGLHVEAAIRVVKVEAPSLRQKGVMVKDARELIQQLKFRGVLQ
jgi:electron transfer flavoprotein beta subunit